MTIQTNAIQVTCSAPVNIAVIKYWGKRDSAKMLPTNSSLSVTLSQDHLKSTTTIRASPLFSENLFYLNGEKQDSFAKRFLNCLELSRRARNVMEKENANLRKISHWNLAIASVNNFPTAAGLASSASGFACLTFALAKLYELDLSVSEISRIARMGSGSACRSLFGGYVAWEMGTEADGSDSMAVQVARQDEWADMEALILVVSDARKDVGSTIGMQETVDTSELLQYRIDKVVPERMTEMENAIKERNFDRFAEITMQDSNQFHAVCLDTFPPVFYLNDISRAIIQLITVYNSLFLQKSASLQKTGYRVAYTFDAGPNAVLYMPRENVPEVLGLINYFFPTSFSGATYYGRALEYTEQIKQEKLNEIIRMIPLSPWPIDSLRRIISTTVGDGPRLLSRSCDDGHSLLDEFNMPKK